MDNPKLTREQRIAKYVAANTSEEEKVALRHLIERLMAIRDQPATKSKKIRLATQATKEAKIVMPVLELMLREIKRFGWDERGQHGRVALGASGLGVLVFGGQGAGIAAFGSAIGVPLWLVLGGGATLMSVIYSELAGKKSE